ncbi:MAG: tRNA (adenosine(37)-N6)-dimethylallyltransferase MiaA [Candidatus Kaiserbacteria bacterium]|nr:tRNA (adenosine(37)-N6)-dimethylallyltransferase MiaA [Candidatus Kaiserbacteria bacterium]
MKQKVLVILGPTASGKSALGVALARRFNGEIISADSRQVYRGMDIGTGKITKHEMKGVGHYLLDVASPKKKFTAGDYAIRGQHALGHISKRDKLPIIVGGTGFYIDTLLGRITLSEVTPDTKLRAALQKKSTARLYALLKKRDPARAHKMNTPSERNNKVRLIRALEIANHASSKSKVKKHFPYKICWIGIAPPFPKLEKNIKKRLKARLKAGMIAEARRLKHDGLSYKRMRELGLEYRSLADLLEQKIDRAKFEASLYRDIRRYARKQLAYWKRNKDIRWFDPKDRTSIEAAVRRFIKMSS